MTKTIILGMNNPSDLHPGEALATWPKNSAGKRLFEISSMDAKYYDAKFERINLLADRHWETKKARKAATELRLRVKGRRVIVLGRASWKALGFPPAWPWFATYSSDHAFWVPVPHTSGRCYLYNDPAFIRKLRNFMRSWAL